MTKAELKDKIKNILGQIYNKPEKVSASNIVAASQAEKFPILNEFPDLRSNIVLLLTPEYETFIDDIHWVAPKPLTFRVVLVNGEMFYLIHTDRSWIAQVEGKKYYLLNVGEEEEASKTISRLLYFANQNIEKKEIEPEVPLAPKEEETPTEKTPPTS
jgi:hypothetical protein